jgi:hypothetical protein
MHKQYVGKTLPVASIDHRDETTCAANGEVEQGSNPVGKPPRFRH